MKSKLKSEKKTNMMDISRMIPMVQISSLDRVLKRSFPLPDPLPASRKAKDVNSLLFNLIL